MFADGLPDDARRLVLHHLPVRSLIACEGVSKHLRSAATEDEIWRSRCEEHWPRCNIGSAAPSCRACFANANGWWQLSTLPRTIIECVSGRRPRGYSNEITAIDSDETTVISAMDTICLRSGETEKAWKLGKYQKVNDLKLLPDGSGAALALIHGAPAGDDLSDNLCGLCQVVRLDAHSVEYGTMNAPLPEPVWSNRDTEGTARFGRRYSALLLSGPSHAFLLNTHDNVFPLARLDLSSGALTDERGTHHDWPVYDWKLRSACADGDGSPHELTIGMMRASESVLVHHDIRVPDPRNCTLQATGHAHVRRVRQGSTGTHTVLTSHSRSKAIEVWDLRKFGSSGFGSGSAGGGTAGHVTPRAEPADRFVCAGNAPDMHCAHGIVTAISGGPPGTTYGAKLHVFSASPRRLSAECALPEIVIDDGHRLTCPLGITRTGRTLTLIADRQRLLQCRVP